MENEIIKMEEKTEHWYVNVAWVAFFTVILWVAEYILSIIDFGPAIFFPILIYIGSLSFAGIVVGVIPTPFFLKLEAIIIFTGIIVFERSSKIFSPDHDWITEFNRKSEIKEVILFLCLVLLGVFLSGFVRKMIKKLK
jgi:hypothetical protein